MAAVDLVREVVALDKTGNLALNHLWRMIQEKNAVHLERYKAWALSILGR